MSKHVHDPVIDPTDDSDLENDVLPSTAGQEHLDLATSNHDATTILGGVFNGDSLVTGVSPFKKSYSNISLEDEPLPIESVALSPFCIEHMRNSPLSTRSKDPHSFSVEVPDSLPSHVMELDSPEHDYDDYDFNIESATTPVQKKNEETEDIKISQYQDVSEKLQDFFSQNITDEDAQLKSRKQVEEEGETLRSSHNIEDNVTLSQADLFESQTFEGDKQSDIIIAPLTDTDGKPSTSCKLSSPHKTDCSPLSKDTGTSEEHKLIQYPFGDGDGKSVTLSPTVSSPTKRKREPSEEYKEGLENKLLKTDTAEEVPSDSEVEFLGDVSHEQSIEVVYEKKKTPILSLDSECLESQDLKLVLTGTQTSVVGSQIISENISQLNNEKGSLVRSGLSFSLLSMSDSESLVCKDSLSSNFSEITPLETTISATQVEGLCKPAILSQPNIEPLLEYPIKVLTTVKVVGSNHLSTKKFNNIACSDKNTSQILVSQGLQKSVLTNENAVPMSNIPPLINVESQLFSEYSATSKEDKKSEINIPHFATPSSQVQSQEDASESIFAKASKAAKEKLIEENNSVVTNEAVAFDSSSEVENKQFDSCINSTDSINTNDNGSNHSTPVCPITHSQSSQSTPVSSQEVQERSSTWLFPNIVNNNEDSEPIVASQTYVEDSDDEQKIKNKVAQSVTNTKPPKKHDLKQKTSTPNNSSDISPNYSADPSSISKVSGILSSTNSSKDHISPAVISPSSINSNSVHPMQDVYVDLASVNSVSDLIEAGLRKVCAKKVVPPVIDEWVDPITRDVVYTLATATGIKVLKDDTSWKKVIYFSDDASVSSSKTHNRISDISSISAGYLGDKSSSVHSFGLTRLESTRLSMASVVSIGGSFDNNPGESQLQDKDIIELDTYKSDGEFFIPPKPLRKPMLKSHVILTKSTSEENFSPPETKPRRVRGRGRPRGRSRGRGRGMGPPVTITEDDSENSSMIDAKDDSRLRDNDNRNKSDKKNAIEVKPTKRADAPPFTPPPGGLPEDEILKFLPEDMKKALLEAQIPLSEEEEEIFTRGYKLPADEKKFQYEEVLRRVRLAVIKVNTLVFARYDGSFYSAIVKRAAEKDKWEVEYNLDKCISCVREVYILPTDILPKGLPCYVRHANRNYSDPGIVVGHIFNSDPRIHLIETYKGTIMKVTHSHIILKASVANELLNVRCAFHSLVASPGGNVNLDNIIFAKTRRESKSPLKLQSLPRSSKPDSNLDSSYSEAERKCKSAKGRSKSKLATMISDSTESYDEPSGLRTPKSSQKNLVSTPQTPKNRNSRTPKTPKTLTRTSKAKKPLPLPVEEDVEESSGTLMNPVVELIQLEEAKLSPKSSPKKRGRKPGSGQNPKKILKCMDDIEDDHNVVNPVIGELPKEGCQILKGYKILITYPDNPNAVNLQSENEAILDLDKDYLKKQIKMAQGEVLESFSQIYCQATLPRKVTQQQTNLLLRKTLTASESPTQFLCISNTYSLTAKFIQCLTVGIPIVNFQWISHSIAQNKCLNWYNYLLPAGMSLLTGNLMEQSCNDTFKNIDVGKVAEVLKGEKVFLATSSNVGFKDLWSSLLSTADATVFVMPSSGGKIQRLLDRRTSVVIADSSIPPEEEKRANDVGVPIVSSQWFIQSLLARCKLPYDAHPEFNYKYKRNKLTQDKGDVR